MNENSNSQHVRLRIRVSSHSLSFAVLDHTSANKVAFEPYTVKSGMSMAANLREAFKESELLNRGYRRVEICLDTPVMLVPLQEFSEETAETYYQHTFDSVKKDVVLTSVLPTLNAVAVYSINKDLRLVIEDNFADVRFSHVSQPVWSYMHNRSHTGIQRKLYAYFHDKSVEVFSFDKHRFRFHNTFDANSSRDAIYYIMYAWKQLAFDNRADELYVCGNSDETDFMMTTIRKYLQRAFVINASAEFNRAPITQIKGVPFDTVVLFIRGK